MVMVSSLQSRRRALSALMLVTGAVLGSFLTRTPDIRDELQASTSGMGFVLFALSVGAMIGVLVSGKGVAGLGTRPVIAAGFAGQVLCLPLVTVGLSLASESAARSVVAFGLFAFGLGMGTAEVAINVEATEVERLSARAFLPLMHGFFSVGLCIGACAGVVFTALDTDVRIHLVLAGSGACLLVAGSLRAVPPHTGKRSTVRVAAPGSAARSAPGLLRDGQLLLIAGIALSMAFAEGTANDWLPLILVDGHGLSATQSSVAFAGFAAITALARFGGVGLVHRVGQQRVLSASAVVCGVGIALVAFVDNGVVASVAVMLWALGVALGFPLAISAAGASGGHDAAARVSLVASVGYLAVLTGPPLLGFLGDHFGLRTALAIPLLGMCATAVVVRLLNDERSHEPSSSLEIRS